VSNLQRYLNEIKEESILVKLKKDVKEEYLKYFKNTDKPPPYRTTYRVISLSTIEKFNVRKDRLPVDTNIESHIMLDDLFKEKFGWKVRSEGVFVWSHFHVDEPVNFLFFPIGNYKIVFNKDIDDLYDELSMNDLYNKLDRFLRLPETDKRRKRFLDDLKTKLKEDIVEDYKEVDSISKVNIGSLGIPTELVFKCESYYLVNKAYFNMLKEKL
jgi:hypothetical protein